jgi:hypothetical protein
MMFDEQNKFTDQDGIELNGAELFSELSRKQANRLASDSEWSEKICIHIQKVILAFAHGVISSYPYYRGFHLPQNFELVMNKMSDLLHDEFRDQLEETGSFECVYVGLLKLRGVYKRLAYSIPEYCQWNEIGNTNGEDRITHRYSPTLTEPEFIDTDVPPHNACVYLLHEERKQKEFDKKFKEKYGDLE